jgi:hypothetical protein
MDARDPALRAALAPATALEALVSAGGKVLRFPLAA